MKRDHAADEGKRDIAHDDDREERRLIAAIEHEENQSQRQQRQAADQPAGILLGSESAVQNNAIALGKRSRGARLADRLHDLRHVGIAADISEDDDPALPVFAQHLIGTIAFLNRSNAVSPE